MPRIVQVSVIVFVALISLVAAPVNKPTQNKPTSTVYSQTPFDGDVPPGFIGHDAAAVYKALVTTRPSEKSEFETKAQYEERIKGNADRPLFEKLRASSVFAFVVPSGKTATDDQGLQSTYDADSQSMNIEIGFDSVASDGDFNAYYVEGVGSYSKTMRSLLWHEEYHPQGSYVGSNAFGAKVKVEKGVGTKIGIAFDTATNPVYKPAGYDSPASPSPRKVSFNVPLEEAKHLKGDLRLLVIATLVEPYTLTDQQHTAPTIDYSYDIDETYEYVKVQINDIWIFGQSTGKVYWKLSSDEPASFKNDAE